MKELTTTSGIKPIVSVIMPVYNSDQYISEAIESVLKQSMPDFELILVDDGSTDSSGIICDQFKKKDVRIKVIHKTNGGVSSARNIGIYESVGEYITFIDNDDIYDKDFLKVLISAMKSADADLSKAGRKNIKITFNNKILGQTESTYKDICMDYETFSAYYPEIKKSGVYSSIWNGIYKRSIILENKILFDESVRHGNEDIIFNSVYSVYCKKIIFVKDLLYTHFYRFGHSTSAKFYDDQIITRIKAIKLEMNLVSDEEGKKRINLEGIRECFHLLLPLKNYKDKVPYIEIIKNNLDFSVLKKTHILTSKYFSGPAKYDLMLIKSEMYRLYFLLRNIT